MIFYKLKTKYIKLKNQKVKIIFYILKMIF